MFAGRRARRGLVDSRAEGRILSAVNASFAVDRDAVGLNPSCSVVVTGANGFVGSNLCRRFAAGGFRVTGVVRRQSDLRALDGVKIDLVRADLRRPAEIRLPSDTRYLIHAASVVSDNATDAECRAGILDATCNLVAAAEAQCPRLERFVYISTALVLGYGRDRISPTRPGRPVTDMPYVLYKRLAEEFLLERYRQHGLPLVVLRPADVFGPHDRVTTMPLLDTLGRGVPILVGAGKSRLAYCYVGNLAQAVERACLSGCATGGCYTVANSTALDWSEFIGALGTGMGRKPRAAPRFVVFGFVVVAEALRRFLPWARPPVTAYRFRRATNNTTYDISATVRDLGYCPDEDVAAQLGATCQWYCDHRALAES